MKRRHIHMTKGLPDGNHGVISGMRWSCEVIIKVDMMTAMDQGELKFYRSSNGVILTPGTTEGVLPMRYFVNVVDRLFGEII